jgi:hypothetical protein
MTIVACSLGALSIRVESSHDKHFEFCTSGFQGMIGNSWFRRWFRGHIWRGGSRRLEGNNYILGFGKSKAARDAFSPGFSQLARNNR